MKNLHTFISLALLAVFLLSNCKKGENDPAISLKTRKARLCRKWHMTKGSAALTYLGNSRAGDSESFVFDGNGFTLDETPSGGTPVVYTGKYFLNLSFSKDGTFTVEEFLQGSTLKASGTWDFLSGVGELKSKEAIVMTISSVTSGEDDNHLFNQLNNMFTYKLNELKSSEIIIEAAASIYLNANGDRTSFVSQYTLKEQ